MSLPLYVTTKTHIVIQRFEVCVILNCCILVHDCFTSAGSRTIAEEKANDQVVPLEILHGRYEGKQESSHDGINRLGFRHGKQLIRHAYMYYNDKLVIILYQERLWNVWKFVLPSSEQSDRRACVLCRGYGDGNPQTTSRCLLIVVM